MKCIFFFCIIICKCVKLLLKAKDGVKLFFFLYSFLQNMVHILSNYFYFFHDVNSIYSILVEYPIHPPIQCLFISFE